jgi:hypothetical protein
MKIRIPNKLEDITLEQVQKVLLIDERQDIEDFAKKVHSVAIMTGNTAEQISSVVISDLEAIYNQIFNMINSQNNAPLKRHLKYLGREYAFIEDVRDMETGAFIDIDQMCKDGKYAENLHKIMAILYRPVEAKIGKNYKLKSYVNESTREKEERQAVFLKHMTLDIVRGATSFFLLVTQRCLNIYGESFPILTQETMKAILGDGITSFTEQPESV